MTSVLPIAKEKSTFAVICSFKDEDGDAATPDWIKWSLTDDSGTVINNRDQVDFTPPAASITILLQGNDLQILAGESAQQYATRKLIIEAQYDSTLGNDLPLNDQLTFAIENLTKIS